MFAWSQNEHKSALTVVKPDDRKIKELQTFYEGVEVCVIDEVSALPAASLALMEQTMTAIFNPKHKKTGGELLPFGGKKRIILGDPAQLRPIGAAAIYDDGLINSDLTKVNRQSTRTKTNQYLYKKYLESNCIMLQRGQRNNGLLAEICDRLREGQQTADDCTKLVYQRAKFPSLQTDCGIHYENDVCAMHNWRQLWNECSSTVPSSRLYLCKATYHCTPYNQDIVDTLSVLPARAYEYAPDIQGGPKKTDCFLTVLTPVYVDIE